MQCIGGVFLPDREHHMVEWMTNANKLVDGKLTYQYTKFQVAMKHVREWRTAVDIGAHVGTWSMHLAKKFKKVVAFEPEPTHVECFRQNVVGQNIELHQVALGNAEGTAGFEYETGSSGGTHLMPGDAVKVCRLDDFNLEHVDFIKIDVEGYELYAVQGGETTIRQNHPTLIVEQKPKGLAERYGVDRMAAVHLLTSWGAEVKCAMSGDYVLAWP